MHCDKFNLAFLGKRSVRRASDIKHNPDTDCWGIYMDNGKGEFMLTGNALQGFAEYEEARKFEVEWLNRCRMIGLAGGSHKAIHFVAPLMRYEFLPPVPVA